MQQERHTYSKSFKAQVVAECALPDTSIASVALTHNLNANLVHKWIRLHGQKSLTLQTSFIPIKSPVPVALHLGVSDQYSQSKKRSDRKNPQLQCRQRAMANFGRSL